MLAEGKKMAWLASHPSCCHTEPPVWMLLTHKAVVPRWLSVEPTIWVDIVSEEFLETQPGAHLDDQWNKTSSVLPQESGPRLLGVRGKVTKLVSQHQWIT